MISSLATQQGSKRGQASGRLMIWGTALRQTPRELANGMVMAFTAAIATRAEVIIFSLD